MTNGAVGSPSSSASSASPRRQSDRAAGDLAGVAGAGGGKLGPLPPSWCGRSCMWSRPSNDAVHQRPPCRDLAATLPWLWQTPSLFDASLMIGLGLASGLGQYLLYESFRRRRARSSGYCAHGIHRPRLGGDPRLSDLLDPPTHTGIVGAVLIVVAERYRHDG